MKKLEWTQNYSCALSPISAGLYVYPLVLELVGCEINGLSLSHL